MSNIEIREEVHKYIDNSTDDIVAALYAMLKTYNHDNDEVVDIQEYNADIDRAMKAMDNGEFDLHDDVKKEFLK